MRASGQREAQHKLGANITAYLSLWYKAAHQLYGSSTARGAAVLDQGQDVPHAIAALQEGRAAAALDLPLSHDTDTVT